MSLIPNITKLPVSPFLIIELINSSNYSINLLIQFMKHISACLIFVTNYYQGNLIALTCMVMQINSSCISFCRSSGKRRLKMTQNSVSFSYQ